MWLNLYFFFNYFIPFCILSSQKKNLARLKHPKSCIINCASQNCLNSFLLKTVWLTNCNTKVVALEKKGSSHLKRHLGLWVVPCCNGKATSCKFCYDFCTVIEVTQSKRVALKQCWLTQNWPKGNSGQRNQWRQFAPIRIRRAAQFKWLQHGVRRAAGQLDKVRWHAGEKVTLDVDVES